MPESQLNCKYFVEIVQQTIPGLFRVVYVCMCALCVCVRICRSGTILARFVDHLAVRVNPNSSKLV